MTLAEHDALLKEEGRYDAMVEEQQQREQERQTRAREWRKAAAPLVADLQAAGVQVESEWDLVNTTEPYRNAVPVLLQHLPKGYPDRVREGIARALAARGPELLAARRDRRAWDVLVTEFRKSEDPTALGAKWGIACALSVAGDDTVIDEVIRIIREERHGMKEFIREFGTHEGGSAVIESILLAASAATPPPDTLVAVPEPTAQALQYFRGNQILWIVNTLLGFAIHALFLFTGWSAKLRDLAKRIGRKRKPFSEIAA